MGIIKPYWNYILFSVLFAGMLIFYESVFHENLLNHIADTGQEIDIFILYIGFFISAFFATTGLFIFLNCSFFVMNKYVFNAQNQNTIPFHIKPFTFCFYSIMQSFAFIISSNIIFIMWNHNPQNEFFYYPEMSIINMILWLISLSFINIIVSGILEFLLRLNDNNKS